MTGEDRNKGFTPEEIAQREEMLEAGLQTINRQRARGRRLDLPRGRIPSFELMSPDGEVSLRVYVPSDAEEIFKVIDASREHLSQYDEDTAIKYPTLDSVVQSIMHPPNRNRLRLAIRNGQGKIVGAINLTPDKKDPDRADRERGEVGYWLGEEFTGKGYVGRAVETLTQYGFDNLGYDEIYGEVHPDNAASIHVLKKAGYQQTGEGNKGRIVFTKYKSS